MSRISDFRSGIPRGSLSDDEIERILMGVGSTAPELTDLTSFVEAVRFYNNAVQSDDTHWTAHRAAAIVRSQVDNHSSTAVDGSSAAPRRLAVPRLAAAAAGLILLMGLSGIAVAADDSAPGDALYGLDRALEQFGVRNGRATERIAEADELLAAGRTNEAYAHLNQSLDQAVADLDTKAAEKIQRHLHLAETKTNSNAAAVQENVAEKKQFIEENKAKGVGADGKEFGQEVSGIAKPKSDQPEIALIEPAPKETGAPDHAGPKEDKGKAPAHAGPKDK